MPKPKQPARDKGNLLEGAAKQPFTKVRDGGEVDRAASAHPLHRNMSRVEEALGRMSGKGEEEEVLIERMEEWRDSVCRLAASPDGQTFLKLMIKASGLFNPGSISNTVKSVEEKAKADFYLRYVRPYLSPDLKQGVE